MLQKLPDDVYLTIFAYLELDDILRLRTVNKEFLQLTRAGSLWWLLLRIHIVQKNIPIPGIRGSSFSDFQAHELEEIVIRSHKLRLTWTAPNPVAKAVTTIPPPLKGRIIFLQFLRRPGCHWLLSISVQDSQEAVAGISRFSLECWDSSTSPLTCIARREFHRFLSIAVNEDPTENGVVAIQAPFITIYSIRPTPDDPESGFIPTAMFPEREDSIHVFCGSKMLSTHPDGRVLAWDTKRPGISCELTNPVLPTTLEHRSVLAAIFDGQCVIVVRPTVCGVYALPHSSPISHVIDPVSQFIWPWQVDKVVMSTVVVSRRNSSRQKYDAHPYAPITILIRFGSGFPWPINLLHQFELEMNASFLQDQAIRAGNSPYRFPPLFRQTIASPVRLFSQTDMALGPRGTAVWIDSHTEDHFGQPSQGQRLASRVTQEETLDHTATSVAASVMSWNEADSWVKLAMDEEEGKLALGHRNGDITLLSYI